MDITEMWIIHRHRWKQHRQRNGPINASAGEGQDTLIVRAHDAVIEAPDFFDVNGRLDGMSRGGVPAFAFFEIIEFEPGVDALSIEADAITADGRAAIVVVGLSRYPTHGIGPHL
ncbi:hypothetical protein [uncultured Tateyamaria sp.]|uniref:hypothetical protein n=1 Tax=Tateyamaria sp. 1078 TaxID=3417464 RepID=UPI00260C1F9D|nr:hypothetical protein [uncultured Tateyamaria sp.]